MRKKQTIEDVRQRLKWAKSGEERNQKWGERWRDHAFDIQAKLDLAIERLRIISIGASYPAERGIADNSEVMLQKTAAIGLAKIARMQERKP